MIGSASTIRRSSPGRRGDAGVDRDVAVLRRRQRSHEAAGGAAYDDQHEITADDVSVGCVGPSPRRRAQHPDAASASTTRSPAPSRRRFRRPRRRRRARSRCGRTMKPMPYLARDASASTGRRGAGAMTTPRAAWTMCSWSPWRRWNTTIRCPTPPALPRVGVRRRVAVHDAAVDRDDAEIRRRLRFHAAAEAPGRRRRRAGEDDAPDDGVVVRGHDDVLARRRQRFHGTAEAAMRRPRRRC